MRTRLLAVMSMLILLGAGSCGSVGSTPKADAQGSGGATTDSRVDMPTTTGGGGAGGGNTGGAGGSTGAGGAGGSTGAGGAGGSTGTGGAGGSTGAGGTGAIRVRGGIEPVGPIAPAGTVRIIRAGLTTPRTRVCNATVCVSG